MKPIKSMRCETNLAVRQRPETNKANTLSVAPERSKPELDTAERAFQHLKHLAQAETEEVWAVALGPQKSVLSSKMIFRGTVDSCLVHPRDIFRFACLANASSILIAHNHPSGELGPSYEDLRFTHQLLHASRVMEIPVVDHLILTRHGYTSLRSESWVDFASEAE